MPPKKKNKVSYTQLETPKKNKIIGAAQFCEENGYKYTKVSLASTFKASRKQVDTALQSKELRTGRSSQSKADNPRKLTERDKDHIQLTIEENGPEGHQLSWSELVDQFGFDVDARTLRSAMAPRGYFTFIPASKPYIDDEKAALRQSWAKHMLEKHPRPEDWYHIRFSDEVDFGWGPEGRSLIIRRRGNSQRGAPDNIQRRETRDKNNPNDSKRLHFWAAVGYNFKSPLVSYTVQSNNNGKMTHQAYIDNILEPVVSTWCNDDKQWTLEEDGDSGHGKSQNDNPVEKWKRAHGLSRDPSALHRYYFNCPQSPDLTIIEDTWQYPKQYVRKKPHWDDELVLELAQEAWKQIPQDWINKLVHSMPQRLQDCIDSRGQMVEQR